jgi:hypothetical protein
MIAFATPKGRETIELQVVSSQTKTHGSPPGEVFRYTDVMSPTLASRQARSGDIS